MCPSHDGQRYHRGQQSNDQKSLAHKDLRYWPGDYGVPRRETDVRPMKFFSCVSEGIPDQVKKTLI